MRLIIGIGNPGQQYEHTRHNCGFMALDAIFQRYGLGNWTKRFQALTCDWLTPSGEKALLIKPQTYVNQSGSTVVGAMSFYKVVPSEVLVVVDDIHLPLGHLRLRPEGSAGGHNGLRDIERCIGKNYARLRLGIGQPSTAAAQVDFVLGRFQADERGDVDEMLAKTVDCITAWIADGQGIACKFNGPLRLPPPPPKKEKPINPSHLLADDTEIDSQS